MRITFNKAFSKLIDQMAKKVASVYSADLKEARNIARNIIRVEVSVFLLRLLKPKEDKIDAISYLFYSLVQPGFLDLSPIHQRYLANLHALLPHWKAKRSVRNQLRQYSQHNRRRLGLHVEIDWETETFAWHTLTHEGREKVYERILGSTLDFRKQKPSYFSGLKGRYYDYHGQSFRSFSIPETLNYKSTAIPLLNCNHVKDRSPVVVSLSSLQESAQEMDKIWQKTGLKPKRWVNRLENIKIRNMKQELEEVQEIRIEGTQHWVGPLSVGKSSVLEVLSYYMVQKRKEKVTLIVPNISEMFRLIDVFHLMGINAVPIMSDRQRQNHIQQYLQSLGKEDLQREGLHIAKRKSFRYLSASCLLKTMETGSSTDSDTVPPCFRLQEDGEFVFPKKNKKYVCPFFSSCDYHRMYQEMEKADIYVTNINSLLVSTLPSAISKEKMLTLEYVLRCSSLVLVDEADNVQSISDGNFVPHEELTSDVGGWLDRLAGEVRVLLDKNPAVQWQDEEVHHWLTNVTHAQVIQTEIRFLLEYARTRRAVRSFIGKYPFTGKGLLAKLSLYLAGIPIQQNEDGIQVDNEEMNRKRKIYEKLTNLFFKFYQAYREDEENQQLEDRVKRLKEIVEIADRFEMSNRVETYLKEVVEHWNLHVKDWEEMKIRFLLALRICNFEKRLHILTHGYAHVADLLEVEAVRDTAIFRGLSPEYQSFVPINPLGLQFGFRYDGGSERENRGGVLSVFRYVGVGRYLIQFFNQLFQHLDGQAGAHTVLISATSFAPESTRYHINLPVRYVICRKDNAQPSVKYVYRPGVTVSGKIGKKREDALQQQIQHLLQDDFLLHELNNAPPGRKRALLLTGSYDESKFCARYLKDYPSFKGQVYSLTKKLDPGDEDWQIERQKVTAFAESGGKVLFAPRAALERGLNILTSGGEGPVAAFSLLFYLVRPYPVPYDLSGMASLLNDFAMRNYLCRDNQRATLYEEMMNLKQQAYQMQREFFRISYGYRRLEKQRNKVLMDLNVSCAQIEGRLFRGPVPQQAKVFFLDASFSPREAHGKEDSAQTSMLKGWEEVLSPSNLSLEEKRLMEILYGFRQRGLSQLKTF